MKTLFLLRHAKASNDDPTLPDIERPLAERGFSDARLVSETLRVQHLVPEKIISSSAVRAYTTAYIFAAAFEKVSTDIERVDALYDSSAREYLRVISSISDAYSSCLITGHNDTITEVAELLLGKNMDLMKTCGVVIISSDAQLWSAFDTSPCRLQMNLFPSLLR
jgi:phosphohistidine phosphatase